MEISQSGRGAHVWVFFAGAVSATIARSAGTRLVHEAMVLRGSMDLRSYDRLFPERGHTPLVLQGGMSVADRRATVTRVTDAKAGDGVLVIGTTPFIGAEVHDYHDRAVPIVAVSLRRRMPGYRALGFTRADT